jgi:hypothetical protein
VTAHVFVDGVGSIDPPFDDVQVVSAEAEDELGRAAQVFYDSGELVVVVLGGMLYSGA